MPIRAMGNFLLCSILLGNVLVSAFSLHVAGRMNFVPLLGEQHNDDSTGRVNRRWGHHRGDLLHIGYCCLWRDYSSGGKYINISFPSQDISYSAGYMFKTWSGSRRQDDLVDQVLHAGHCPSLLPYFQDPRLHPRNGDRHRVQQAEVDGAAEGDRAVQWTREGRDQHRHWGAGAEAEVCERCYDIH